DELGAFRVGQLPEGLRRSESLHSRFVEPRLGRQFLGEKSRIRGFAVDDVLEAESLIERARTGVVLLNLERQLAAPRLPGALFRRTQQFSAHALAPVLGKHGKIVDIEQRHRSKRGHAEEAYRDPDGTIVCK